MNRKTSSQMQGRTRAVFFDLGGVVVDIEKEHCHIAWIEETGLPPETFERVFFDSGLKAGIDRGSITPDQALSRLNEALGIGLERSVLERIWNAMIRFRPSVIELVSKLSKSTQVGVISTTDPIHASLIAGQPELRRTVSCWTFSFEVRSVKPEPKIYACALIRMGVRASDALLIDDRLENVLAAKNLGWQAIQYQDLHTLTHLLRNRGLLSQ